MSNGLRHGGSPVRVVVTAVGSGWLVEVSDAAGDIAAGPGRRPRRGPRADWASTSSRSSPRRTAGPPRTTAARSCGRGWTSPARPPRCPSPAAAPQPAAAAPGRRAVVRPARPRRSATGRAPAAPAPAPRRRRAAPDAVPDRAPPARRHRRRRRPGHHPGAGVAGVRRQREQQREAARRSRSRRCATLLATQVAVIQTQMADTGHVAVATDGRTQPFLNFAAATALSPEMSLSLWRVTGDQVERLAVHGPDPQLPDGGPGRVLPGPGADRAARRRRRPAG